MLAAIALFGAFGHADAATIRTNIVQAPPPPNCTVEGTDLDFGSDTLVHLLEVGRPHTDIRINCTRKADFQVGINNGSHPAAGHRRMIGGTGTDFLVYELYKDRVGSDRFGDAIVSERVSGTARGSGRVSVPVYAELGPGQSLPPGTYADNAVITVYF